MGRLRCLIGVILDLIARLFGASAAHGPDDRAPARAPIDWALFEERALELLSAELKRFSPNHDYETFYALALECEAATLQLRLCANTEGALRFARECEMDGDPGAEELPADLRWEIASWEYQGFNLDFSAWHAGYEPLLGAVRELHHPADREIFLETACRLLIRLESGAAMKRLNRSRDFRVICVDIDESFAQGEERLAAMRAPPSPTAPDGG